DLFDPPTVGRFAAHLGELLRGVVDDPERPLSLLPLLPESERHQLLHEWPAAGMRQAAGPLRERLAAFLPGCRLLVLDGRQEPAPIGVYGELYAELQAADAPPVLQATGIRARYRPDGALEEQTSATLAAQEAGEDRSAERAEDLAARRSQLSASRRALLDKWVGGRAQGR
ncbi:MAG TPA: hypothetical protein VGE98_08860, partial [Thermoanaerobaculia bacterium]